MKKIALYLSLISLFISCSKSDKDGSNFRYEFTSDVSATYTIEYTSGISDLYEETFQGTTWTKTVIAKPDPGFLNVTTGSVTVTPPASWKNTTNSAHVTLKIFVEGSEKARTDSVMTAANVGIGIRELYSF